MRAARGASVREKKVHGGEVLPTPRPYGRARANPERCGNLRGDNGLSRAGERGREAARAVPLGKSLHKTVKLRSPRMSRSKLDRNLGVARRRELEVAAAVAREKIMQFHVSSALRLIALAADRVPPARMLEIHLRLHQVVGAESELLAYRVLAAMGESSAADSARLFLPAEVQPEEDSASLWRVLRSRLRGRVHHDLRRWVELAVGAAQAGMVEIHAEHAVRFARALSETHTVQQSAALYSEMAAVASPLRQPLLIKLLTRLAAEDLPAVSAPSLQDRAAAERPAVRAERSIRRQAV